MNIVKGCSSRTNPCIPIGTSRSSVSNTCCDKDLCNKANGLEKAKTLFMQISLVLPLILSTWN